MATDSFWFLFLLLPSLITKSSSSASLFGIVEPFPENIYPIEFTSAQVTCVAFDAAGVKVPEKIVFMRRDEFNRFVELKPNGNLHFANRSTLEDGKKKLFVTMFIRNVTLADDSLYGALGSYECHAFAVGDAVERRHGFSVSVITRSEIPKVVVPDVGDLGQNDDVTLTCNVTERGNQATTPLKRISWLKDGVVLDSVRNPDPADPRDMLSPLKIKSASIRDGGNYTCLLQVLLRNIREYNVTASTVIRGQEIPRVVVSDIGVLQHNDDVTLTCNLTERGNQAATPLKMISWLKDGVVLESVQNPDPADPRDTLGPLNIKDVGVRDGGNYTCLLQVLLRNITEYNVTASTVIHIAPWFEHKGEKEVVGKSGETAELECSATGFPLKVEWKSRSGVVSCNGSLTDQRYSITRKGKYDPYSMIIADLETTDSGSYYCCLPSNCSLQIDEDRCQKFALIVKDGAMALASRGIFVVMAFFMVLSLIW